MALRRVFGVVKVVLANIWLWFAFGVVAEAVEVAAEAEDLVGGGYDRKFPGQVTKMWTNSNYFQAYYEDNPLETFVAPQCNTTNPELLYIPVVVCCVVVVVCCAVGFVLCKLRKRRFRKENISEQEQNLLSCEETITSKDVTVSTNVTTVISESNKTGKKESRKKRNKKRSKLPDDCFIQNINTDHKRESRHHRRPSNNFKTQRSTCEDWGSQQRTENIPEQEQNLLNCEETITNNDVTVFTNVTTIISKTSKTGTKQSRKKRNKKRNKLPNEFSNSSTSDSCLDCTTEHHWSTSNNYETKWSTWEDWKSQQRYNNINFHQQAVEMWQDEEQNVEIPFVTTLKSSRQLYENTLLPKESLEELIVFYSEKVVVDCESGNENKSTSDAIIHTILYRISESRRFHLYPQIEGSIATSLKVGKADEFDYSVDILIDRDEMNFSEQPFMKTYGDDDLDTFSISQVQESEFVARGKRLFPNGKRHLFPHGTPDDIPPGYTAVQLGPYDAQCYSDCCISEGYYDDDDGWFLPYELLRSFHNSIGETLPRSDVLESVTLNKGARGPAISMTVQQFGGRPNISIDITPKLTLPTQTLSVEDFQWPRKNTNLWLTEEKVISVAYKEIYLVPKGDKYWKISFANCENELLRDIDRNGTWRKECLKIMKKKLTQWKSQSQSGLKGLSTYLLKTTLLWLCETLPYDFFWQKEELANRYLNFLQELEYRLRIGKMGEYFNPSVNLLESKERMETEELRQFIKREIENIHYNI